jgi:type IV secretory pathway VirJ component
MKRFVLTFAFLAALALPAAARSTDDQFTFEKMGPIAVYKPNAASPSSLVIFISGDDGWGRGQPDMADQLTRQGALVAAIDIIKWMKTDLAAKDTCLDIDGELGALTATLRTRYGLPDTVKPVLYGFSSGALMAYVGLAQSKPGTYSGAVSLGFCNDLWLNKPVCKGAGLTSTFEEKRNRTLFDPAAHIKDPWVIINGDKDPYCKLPTQQAFAAQVPGASVAAVKGLSHSFSSGDWLTPFLAAHRSMTGQGVTQ